jgi:NitT/TauT family transport system substrate-binding protein
VNLTQNRRSFLTGVSAIGVAGMLGARGTSAAEGELETNSIVFVNAPGICIAPQYIAEELLRAEGFTDFRYVDSEPGLVAARKLANGEADFCVEFQTGFIMPLDEGAPIKVLSGVHIGCYELFAHEDIRSVVDLKGKRVGIGQGYGSDPHVFASVMATYVGLDPEQDIEWYQSAVEPYKLFVEGKIDAFVTFPPEGQRLRAEKVGHVLVNSMVDRPWSQYFCCMLAAHADFAQAYPIATKRVLRAILKAADLCAADPEAAARLLIDRKYAPDDEFTLQAVKEMRYREWRDYDPEDTLRFFSLRMHESGLIKSGPQDLIARGTDWRFLNELKRELKT